MLTSSLVYVPGGHFEQLTLPTSDLYFPAAQTIQGPPLGPVEPAVQTHADTFGLPVKGV